MTKHGNKLPLRRQRDVEDALLIRSAESLGRMIGSLQRHDMARARLDFDAVGHYARPDVFRLIVDETSRAPVAFQPVASAAPTSDRGTDQ